MAANEGHEHNQAPDREPGGGHLIVELEPEQADAGAVLAVSLPGRDDELNPVTFRVPAGVSDGTLLRVPWRAEPGIVGSATDVLYVRVRIKSGATPDAASPPVSVPPPTASGSRSGGRSRRRWAVGAGALLVAVTATTVLAVRGSGNGRSEPVASSGALPPPSSVVTPAMTLAEYAQTVNLAEAELVQGFGRLRTARTPSAVSSAATTLGASLTAHADALRSLVPPEQVKAAHEALSLGLNALGDDIDALVGMADERAVCTGPSAAATAARSDGAQQLRTALSELKAADPSTAYRIGTFLPAPAPLPERRLANGTLIRSAKRGLGELTVKNGGDTDAVVTLSPAGTKTTTVQVYVRASGTAKVTRIPDGVYQVYMTFGTDWDAAGRLFTRTCAFQRFDRTASFETTSTTYSTNSLSITPVPDGNATVSDVDPDTFPTAGA